MNELPQPYWQSADSRHVIYCGDCRELLPLLKPTLPKDAAVVTDPPYGIGFAAQPTTGQRRAGLKPQFWDEVSGDVSFEGEFTEVVIWGGNYFPLRPSRGWLVWNKPDAPPSMGDAELAWTNRDANCESISHSISATNAERVGHPTQKPLAVMLWSIGFVTSQTILDPFMGSGTTGVACIRTGRKFIGIEIEPKYCAIAVERMERELAQPMLPALDPAKPMQQELLTQS